MARTKIPRTRRDLQEQAQEGQQQGAPPGADGKAGRGGRGRPGTRPTTTTAQHDDQCSPTFTAGAPMGGGLRLEESTLDGSSSHGTELTDMYSESDGLARGGMDHRRASVETQDSVDMAVVRIPENQRYISSSNNDKNGTWIPADDSDDVADRGVRIRSYDLPEGSRRNHVTKNGKVIPLAKMPSKEGRSGDATKKMNFTVLDVLLNVVSIGSYLADVGSDLFVAYIYFSHGHWWWFGLTLGFVFLPSIIMTIFSLKWYITDQKLKQIKVSKMRWMSRITFLLLQLAPVLRYIDTVIYGIRSRKEEVKQEKKHWYDQMLFEDTDSAMLRLFECFMEAAPQLCLQLYIMCIMGPNGPRGEGSVPEGTFYHLILVGQVLSSLTSMVSIAWALCAYHRSLRLSLDAKHNMSYPGMALQFLWHFFTVGSRIIAISLFASYFKRWVFVLVGAHWVTMFTWILIQRTHFCAAKWEEFFFNVVGACVYIFCYFNLTEGHTRLRYLFYYTVVYSENAAMSLTWYLFTQTKDIWYHSYGLVAVLLGFLLGVMFQIIYYLKLHPNNRCGDPKKRIRCWIPLHELVGEQGEINSMEMSDMGMREENSSNVNNRYHRGEDSDSTDCGKPLMGDIC